MKVQSITLSLCLALVVGVVAYGSGRGQSESNAGVKRIAGSPSQNTVLESAKGKDEYVGIYVASLTRQVKMSELAKAYPSQTAGQVSREMLAADAIVGWYDRGGNYHAEKMQNALKRDMGALRIQPEMLRGVALRGSEVQPR